MKFVNLEKIAEKFQTLKDNGHISKYKVTCKYIDGIPTINTEFTPTNPDYNINFNLNIKKK